MPEVGWELLESELKLKLPRWKPSAHCCQRPSKDLTSSLPPFQPDTSAVAKKSLSERPSPPGSSSYRVKQTITQLERASAKASEAAHENAKDTSSIRYGEPLNT
jgi:hypothetical protein